MGLDTLWGKIIRSSGYCRRCGRTNNLQAAHIVSRRWKQTRWDVDNGICLCINCHNWGHANPKQFDNWIEDTFPGRLEGLKIKRQGLEKVDKKQVRKLLKDIYERSIK